MRLSVLGGVVLRAVIVAAGAAPSQDQAADRPVLRHLADRARIHPRRDADGNLMRGTQHESETDNWSGYFVANYQTSALYNATQGTWIIPSVTYGTTKGNHSQEYSASWIGIGGVCLTSNCDSGNADDTLIQLGTEQDVSRSGTPTYYAWYEMLPADSVTIPYPVNPGDRMTATVQCVASCTSVTQSWTLTMSDVTASWTWSQTFSYASSRLSAEWIEEATSICSGNNTNSCTIQPLADFNTATFTAITANGSTPVLTLDQNGISLLDSAGQTAMVSIPQGGNFTACWGNGTCNYTSATTPLVAAVLPSSRSVEVGATATAFATMINSGSVAATSCGISLSSPIAATFSYQTTNSSTNGLSGAQNAPVTIAAGAAQSFVMAITPSSVLSATDTQFEFGCANVDPASIITGVNTLLFSASATPVPDIVALSATATNDAGSNGSAALAVATVNVGAGTGSALIYVTADTGSAALPLTLTLCQTNPMNGQCIATPSSVVSATFAANATSTFSAFAAATGAVAFAPATNRIFIRFKDADGNLRGSTSVAVRTQ
jgi:hypothetical protein